MPKRFHPCISFSVACVALSLAIYCAGCNVVGAVAYQVNGPPDNPALYTPAKTPMLVLVENFQHQTSSTANANLLARYLSDDLEANKVAPIVSLDRLIELRDERGKAFEDMSIAAVGHAVGARQVLYVQLLDTDMSPLAGTSTLRGSVNVLVRIIDVQTGRTLWPTDIERGYPMSAATSLGHDASSGAAKVRQRMYLQLAADISKLFHKWQPANMEPEDMNINN